MCIAIIKPGNAPLPTLEQLENCAATNGDGAGLCYPIKGGGVQIIKGMQSAKEVHDFLQTQDFTLVPMMLHFRIGTHGGRRDPKHTHPFPIGRGTEEMEALQIVAQSAMMHNGIMSRFGYEAAISDTMAFARDALPQIMKMPKAAMDIVMSEVLGTHNKVAYMDKNGLVSKFGNWIEDGGLFWSNASYKSYASVASADPRRWGSCGSGAGRTKHGGYNQSGFYSRYDWGDDVPEDFPASPDALEELLVSPGEGELWSDLIEEDVTSVDTEKLSDESNAIVASEDFRARFVYRNRGSKIIRPEGVSIKDWDTLVSYRYMYSFIKDDEWDAYLLRLNEERTNQLASSGA